MKRRLFALLLLLCLLTGCSPVAPSPPPTDSHTVTVGGEDLQVHFIDVGQADAILIDIGSCEVLIDAGNNKDGADVVAYLEPLVQGSLDYVIATHPDADHIGGLDDVLASYQVDTVIDSGAAKDTKTYQEYYQAATSEPNCELLFDDDLTLTIGGAELTVIETGDDYRDSNDNSVVALLEYQGVSVLFTGDMEAAAEDAALERFSDVDVLKAAHHGSHTSSGRDFIDLVRPEYVIISAGLDNKYGHPHSEALQTYLDCGATVYGTFRSGDIIMTIHDGAYSFNTDQKLTAADAGDR